MQDRAGVIPAKLPHEIWVVSPSISWSSNRQADQWHRVVPGESPFTLALAAYVVLRKNRQGRN